MNCEICQMEMHTWRNNGELAIFDLLFRHIESCPVCAERYRAMTELDEQLRRKFVGVSEPDHLQRRIFVGLAHERRQQPKAGFRRHIWMLLPLAASIVLAFVLGWVPYLQQRQLNRELAALIERPPAPQMLTTNRQDLLTWSSNVLHGPSQLPPELSRVQFRGGTAVEVAHHRAVMLRMKNEPRASLLVMDGAIRNSSGFTTIASDAGNASLWTSNHKTYVLLFQGNRADMQAYMVRMGIVA